jgi:hypothetical protein
VNYRLFAILTLLLVLNGNRMAYGAGDSPCPANFAGVAGGFPPGTTGQATPPRPLEELTPGSLCKHPTRRFPGGAICDRNVSPGLKRAVIRDYNQHLREKITDLNRADFKIDHFIPLCLGGSNEKTNLWPQHTSVFAVTDAIEASLCKAFRAGKIRKDQAINLIKSVKKNTSLEKQVWREIRSLR